MTRPYPIRFQPIIRRAIWGGRRLADLLGKSLGDGDDFAESWEVVDHGPDQSVVLNGSWQGLTLHQLITDHGPLLLGRHEPLDQFPLLFKFLDAHRVLSVQVHPNDEQAAKLDPPDHGKTEAWVVVHAEPGSVMYAGLRPSIDREALAHAIEHGEAESCLHRFTVQKGDCVFIPAGTVHALGAGLVVAEIQQSSDTTFRLFDWNRVGPDGRPRPLHVQQGLEVINFQRGPVEPQQPQMTDRAHVQRLVHCDKFVLERWEVDGAVPLETENRFHILAVLEGQIRLSGDFDEEILRRGDTTLLPAACWIDKVQPLEGPATLLDMYLP